MSKQNNVNPGQYEGSRNHQGEGIDQEQQRRDLKQREASRQQEDSNFIPGASGEPKSSSEDKDE
jgi:hypothetical protein